MKRIIIRVRAIFGAPFEPSHVTGRNALQAAAHRFRRDAILLPNPPKGFVAPEVQPVGNPDDTDGNRSRPGVLITRIVRLMASLPGYGQNGSDPKAPDGSGRGGHRRYRRLDDHSERYQNVTPIQALAAGGRAFMMKLPR